MRAVSVRVESRKLKKNKRLVFSVETRNCCRRNRWLSQPCASNPISMCYRKTPRESCSGYLRPSLHFPLLSRSRFEGGSDRESLRERTQRGRRWRVAKEEEGRKDRARTRRGIRITKHRQRKGNALNHGWKC